jgi:hypothetical protein
MIDGRCAESRMISWLAKQFGLQIPLISRDRVPKSGFFAYPREKV